MATKVFTVLADAKAHVGRAENLAVLLQPNDGLFPVIPLGMVGAGNYALLFGHSKERLVGACKRWGLREPYMYPWYGVIATALAGQVLVNALTELNYTGK